MKKTITYSGIGLVLLSLCFIGYKFFGPMRVTGKVFIVKNNSEVVRLPLANIYIADAEQAKLLREAVINSAKSIKQQYAKLDDEIKAIDGLKEKAVITGRIESLKKYSKRIQEINRSRSMAQLSTKQLEKDDKEFLEITGIIEGEILGLAVVSQFEDKRVVSLIRKYAKDSDMKSIVNFLNHDLILGYERGLSGFKSKLSEPLIQRQLALYKEYQALYSPKNLGKLPNQIIASTVTDDNGEFSISVPRGEYYVFADSSRKVVSETEFYYWASPVKTDMGSPTPLILSNQNLIKEYGNSDNLWWFNDFGGPSYPETNKQ